MVEPKTKTTSRFDSIRTRLTLAFILIVLLPMAIISAVQAISGSEGAHLQLATQLDTAVAFKEYAVNTWAATVKNELGNALIGENTGRIVDALVQKAGDAGEFKSAHDAFEGRLRQLITTSQLFEVVFLMNRHGRVLVSTDTDLEGRSHANSGFFQLGKKEPAICPTTAFHMAIIVSRPVPGRDGQAAGVLAGVVRRAVLTKMMENTAGLGKTGKTYLVNGDNILLTKLGDTEPGTTVRSEGIQAALEHQKKLTKAYLDFRGIPVYGAYRWLPELGAVLVAEQEQAEYSHVRRVLFAVNASVALSALLIAVFASLAVTRSIAAPLGDLADTASRIASGHLELAAEVKRRDEIGALAVNFNFMTDKIRQMIDTLRKSEERFRALYLDNPSMYFTVDENGIVLSVNSFGAEQLGYRMEELIGQPVFISYHADDQAGVKRQLEDCLQRFGDVAHWEFRKVCKNGKMLWAREAARAVRDAEGRAVVLIVCEDVTEQKQAEEALKSSEKKFRELFEESKDVVFFSTPEGKYIDINHAGVELYGYSSKEEVLKLDISRDIYLNPEEREKFQSDLEQHGFVKDYEAQFKRKDGEKLTVLVTANAVRDGGGSITAYRGIIRDVTNQRRLEGQLLQAQKMEAIGQLSGGIAHDFNNILTAIIGYATLLKMKIREDALMRSYVDQVLTASSRAKNITQNLLAFSRKQAIHPVPVQVNEIITNIEAMFTQLIREDIKLKTILADENMTIKADSGQIEQVLINLVTNARDAMPQGGTLTIETKPVEISDESGKRRVLAKQGKYASISVTDTGTGMDEKTKEKIFEPFFTTKETGKGTGLGLSIVYGIIKQHNGEITVYSEPGMGTTFRIYFPMIEATVEKNRPQELPEARGGNETLLLAEDDAGVRNLNKTILSEAGYTVLEAADGEDAVRIFIENKDVIQLVLLDVIMPKKSGKEVFSRISSEKTNTGVLFMSGYSEHEIFEQGVLQKGQDFITKPATPQELLKKVREIIDRKRTYAGKMTEEKPSAVTKAPPSAEHEPEGTKTVGRYEGSIVVVEDDPQLLEYVSFLLKENGYAIHACSNAQDAVNALRNSVADVVLTDIVMPGISGLELLEAVHDRDPDMPVIVVTAFADLGKAVESVKKRAYDFIMKPYDPEQLLRSLDKAVRYRKLLQVEKEYKTKLEDFNKERETLVAERSMNLMALTVADRVRNPATVIGLACKKILAQKLPEEQRKYADLILEESNKLESLVKGFHDLLKSRKSVFEYEDINVLIRNIASLVEKESKTKNVKLRWRLSDRPLKINMQKNFLQVAIQHALRNAMEATQPGGTVIVETDAENETVTVTITDTGSGIPEQEVEKIFDPFYSTKTHRYGMGLPMIKQVVSEHLGEIKLISEQGKGTSFRMIFPSRWQEK